MTRKKRRNYTGEWNNAARHVPRKPGRDVDADHSAQPLGQTLGQMEPDERAALVAAWTEERQEALATRHTTATGSRIRTLATLRAADMAARLRIARGVRP